MNTSASNADNPLTEHILAIVHADMPLGAGLRAAAVETRNRNTAAALNKIADEVDAGRPLEDVLAAAPQILPPHITALLGASNRSGRLREAMMDLVEHDTSTRETLHAAYAAIAYPIALLLFAYLCLLFLQWFVVGALIEMLRTFELDLPPATLLIESMYDARWLLVVAPIGLLVVGCGAMALLTPPWRHRLLAIIPLAGKLFHWAGVAQGARALAHLVQQEVPLPEALRLSSQGLRDANVAHAWRAASDEIERGASLSRAFAVTHRLPASLIPLVAWGEQTGNLAEALFMGSEMLEGRVRLRAQLIRTVLPPVMFIVIGGGAYFHIAALLGPMISLIQNLSG